MNSAEKILLHSRLTSLAISNEGTHEERMYRMKLCMELIEEIEKM